MSSNIHKSQFDNEFHRGLNSNDAERRKQQRREQSDRREIERFGFKISTRRSSDDRRDH
jgi:hypothetical protein